LNDCTKILSADSPEALSEAAKLIKAGEVVAIPTETVYGLAANAFDEAAVKRIFEVKGRPQDNPLIVHTYGIDGVSEIAENIPDLAKKLFEVFSPGPLTIVLPKKNTVPDITSGGLKTVGVRIPDNANVRELIKHCGVPLSAPSANISGKPSPTTAAHVYDDLSGKIPLILDGGVCKVGLESTVISITEGSINILRPGKITAEKLSRFGNVIIDKGVTESVSEMKKPSSPGMKYKHYAPKCDITIVDGSLDDFIRYFNKNADEETYALMFDNDIFDIKNRINYGDSSGLFSLLRELDNMNIKKVFAVCPQKNDEGLAVYNRLIRAAGYKIVDASSFSEVR
jgi:L-threonylcarbamoyladenylate synthase